MLLASFLVGYFVALGAMFPVMQTLHHDIAAVQAHRPTVVHPINWWAGAGGFGLGMAVMRWLSHRNPLPDPVITENGASRRPRPPLATWLPAALLFVLVAAAIGWTAVQFFSSWLRPM